MLDPTVRRALDGISIAHLATVLREGSPHTTPVYVGAHTATGSSSSPAPACAKHQPAPRPPHGLSIAPVDNPFQPVVIRGPVFEWIDGDPAWQIIDQLAIKYAGQPYRPSTRTRGGRDRARTADRRHRLSTRRRTAL